MSDGSEGGLLANVSAQVVERELRKIGEAELELERLQNDMNAELNAVTLRHEAQIGPLRRRLDELNARLEASVKANRLALFENDSQTLQLGLGQVRFRRAPARVEPAEGVDMQEVVRRMRKARRRQFYRLVPRLDKAALNRAASAGLLDDEELDKLGLRVVEGGESWTIQTDHEAIRAAVGRG